LFGVTDPGTHDSRYDVADEFVDVCLQLWEGGWDDGAEVRDRARNVYADPAGLHRTEHVGEHFRVSGQFAVAPSRQRTPVLFQAGTSARGRAFAARNAEAVLIQGQTIAKAAEHVADIRAQAVRHGRLPGDVSVVTGVTVTVGATHREALAKRAELEACFDPRDAAVVFAGFTGVDLRDVDPATPLTGVRSDQGQTLIDRFVRPGAPVPTVGQVLDDFRRKANKGFQITGTPTEVADELQAVVDGSDVDGIMLEPTFGGPDCFEEFIEHVQPLLRDRGMLTAPPAGATLRERLSGSTSGRLAPTHPGSRFRPGNPQHGLENRKRP
jgi:FMN-dependent oxidoreductase (nitrilotriacetate monooxygenase family)